jgi:hypothetical protein
VVSLVLSKCCSLVPQRIVEDFRALAPSVECPLRIQKRSEIIKHKGTCHFQILNSISHTHTSYAPRFQILNSIPYMIALILRHVCVLLCTDYVCVLYTSKHKHKQPHLRYSKMGGEDDERARVWVCKPHPASWEERILPQSMLLSPIDT